MRMIEMRIAPPNLRRGRRRARQRCTATWAVGRGARGGAPRAKRSAWHGTFVQRFCELFLLLLLIVFVLCVLMRWVSW